MIFYTRVSTLVMSLLDREKNGVADKGLSSFPVIVHFIRGYGLAIYS